MELAGLGATYDLSRSNADVRSKASEERQAKRLGEMQDAIKRLQAMPTQKQMAKKNSMSREEISGNQGNQGQTRHKTLCRV